MEFPKTKQSSQIYVFFIASFEKANLIKYLLFLFVFRCLQAASLSNTAQDQWVLYARLIFVSTSASVYQLYAQFWSIFFFHHFIMLVFFFMQGTVFLPAV